MDVQFLQLTRNQLNQLPLDTSAFKIGKVLSAMIGQNTNGFTLLLGNKQEVPIKTDLPLTKGETLNFKIAEATADTIVLKLQDPPQKLQISTAKAPEQLALENAMKQAVPKQNTPAALLSNLQQIRSLNPQQLQDSLKQLASDFVKSLPTVKQTTDPQGLKQAIKNSGIFLESKLAHAAKGDHSTSGQLQGDLKANLLKLYSTLSKHIAQTNQGNTTPAQTGATLAQSATAKGPATQQATMQNAQQNVTQSSQSTNQQSFNPHTAAINMYESQHKHQLPFPMRGQFPKPAKGQSANIDVNSNPQQVEQKISTQVEAALSRMQLNQIGSLSYPHDGINATWLLDVPIRTESRTDILQMAIEEREPTDPENPEDTTTWNINLAIELEKVGPMQAAIQIYGKKIQIDVWSEDADSHYFIQSELTDLRRELEKQSFEVEALNSHPGLNDSIELKNTLHLVDEKI